ncbi:DUF418 domain-containing protein [Bacillus sp. 165]|uniref:DUF418 domain-containing protein n=1 Tax=Bacillus sp. 165 TaxID=1529117 RepID=UPI001ADB97E5|nr:DUF418 domain-containing protein [Bacillus sp. 165]MBO9129441.1 DUF418 domain-containing protein [Bacillus sp. 165]
MIDTNVVSENRIVLLDALRGFALFGIFLINIASFTIGGPPGFVESDNYFDNVVTAFLLIFVESKFFTLFSFLFGIGFSIQLLSAKNKNKSFLPQFSRRLAVLFIFGWAHIFFLWDGDILLLYSMVGAILLFFRNSSEKKLIQWVIGLLIIPIIIVTIALITISILRTVPELGMKIKLAETAFINEFKNAQEQTIESFLNSSYLTLAKERFLGYLGLFPLLLSRVPSVLAMFLLGYLVGKKRYLYNIDKNKKQLLKISKWCLAVGIPLNIFIIVMFKILPPLSSVIILFYNQYLTGPMLSLGFASLFILLFNHKYISKILKYFIYTGRLSLSNYIFQSIVYSFLFYNYGLGLYGKLNTWQAVIIAIFIYVVMIYISKWWLSYYRMGLLEWLWRTVTKLEFQTITRKNKESVIKMDQ